MQGEFCTAVDFGEQSMLSLLDGPKHSQFVILTTEG